MTVTPSAPADLRAEIRAGRFRATTAGLAPGYAQANLIVLPREWANEFRDFCFRNPRPIPARLVARASQICAAYPGSHGAPVHAGDPAALGIVDLDRPDFGECVPIASDEVPVFWGCGVTPQVVLQRSGCSWFAAHRPGRMFVSDREETIS